MRKLFIVLGLVGSVALTAKAACVLGKFCADDTGASVAGLGVDGNGFATPVLSSTAINAIIPRYTGQEVVCNTCVNSPASSAKLAVCISTETTDTSAWVLVSSMSVSCK